MFYNIPCVSNQVAFRQLTYVGKILRQEGSHTPTILLTAWCDKPMKQGSQLVTNKDSFVKNLRLVHPDVDDTSSMSTWGLHALDKKYWFLLLLTMKHLSNQTPENPPDGQENDGEETQSDRPLHHLPSSSSTTAKLADRYKISPS